MEIVAKVTHSEGRAKDFFRFHLFKKSPAKYIYFSFALISFSGAIIFFFLNQLFYALFLAFVAILILIVRIVTTNITIDRILKKIRFPSYSYTLKFKEDNLVYLADTIKKEYYYRDLYGIFETKEYIFLYTNSHQALILTKYSLDKDDRTNLTNLLSKYKNKYRFIRFK